MEHHNCTLYLTSEFGFPMGVSCKWAKTEIVKWAQYPRAVKVTYLEKGKRKPRAYIDSYHPRTVIVAGHGHRSPPSVWKTLLNGDVVSRYISFDPRYEQDADAFFATLPILEDFRGFNTMAPAQHCVSRIPAMRR